MLFIICRSIKYLFRIEIKNQIDNLMRNINNEKARDSVIYISMIIIFRNKNMNYTHHINISDFYRKMYLKYK